MTLRSLDAHNAEKQAQYTDSEHLRDVGIPLGIQCPADNCTGELRQPPPFEEFTFDEEGLPPYMLTMCVDCAYTGQAYV